MNKKPDDIVAEKIIEKLLKEELLFENEKEKWMEKLSSENIIPEDWNLLSDFHIKKEE